MYLDNYNNLLTTGIYSNKGTKDDQILDLVGATQNLADDSNISSDKSNTSNMESNKGGTYYIKDLPYWILEESKGGVVNKTKDGK